MRFRLRHRRGRRPPGPARRASGCRCDLSDPKPLWIIGAAGRAARHQCRSAAASAESHAHTMNKATQAVAADHIFDGSAMRGKSAVLIAGEDIVGVVPLKEVPNGT